MFQMKEYPPDILPLYSQGYSLARFFIEQGGKPKFVEYVGEGMRTNNWTATTQKYYGFKSLSDLQLTWVEWVRKGSPVLAGGKVPENLLVSTQPAGGGGGGGAGGAAGGAASRMMSNTQMASLTQQPRTRVPEVRWPVGKQSSAKRPHLRSGRSNGIAADAGELCPPGGDACRGAEQRLQQRLAASLRWVVRPAARSVQAALATPAGESAAAPPSAPNAAAGGSAVSTEQNVVDQQLASAAGRGRDGCAATLGHSSPAAGEAGEHELQQWPRADGVEPASRSAVSTGERNFRRGGE